MPDVLPPHESQIFGPIRTFAIAMMLSSPWVAFAMTLQQAKVETTVNLSQGFRLGDTIFFLADIHRYRPGRTLWLILPFNTGPKTLEHRTSLYSLNIASRTVRLEAVLADPADPTGSVGYTQWTMKDGGLYISYHPNNRRIPETGHTQRIIFRRDMASGAVSAVPEPEKAQRELFAGYKSPYRDNPGVVEVSGYRHLLPAGWLSFERPTD